jgi:distribution and morphology protein 34
LAANSPLTIPVQITLSQFKLSGFIILVFSKAKGITLVFRNDPLESLKVSSTFDSIPFIADYLQKEIERQIRRIFQEDLPVAVHRLSLRLWNPEYAASLNEESTAPAKPQRSNGSDVEDEEEIQLINPLLTPSDSSDGPSTMNSQKNLLKLSSLMDSQKTLSLDTPSISDAVFRAWASGGNPNVTMWDRPGVLDLPVNTPRGSVAMYASSETGDVAETPNNCSSLFSRPSLTPTASSLSMVSTRHGTAASTPGRRKKKHRVVDLRKNTMEKDSLTPQDSCSEISVPSESAIEDGFCDVPPTGQRNGREDSIDYDSDSKPTLDQNSAAETGPVMLKCPPSPANPIATVDIVYPPASMQPASLQSSNPSLSFQDISMQKEKLQHEAPPSPPKIRLPSNAPGGILEHALGKIVGEIQHQLEEERLKRGGIYAQTKWSVERELEELYGNDGLPAYRAAI